MSQAEGHTICMHGGSYKALPSSRILKEVSSLAGAPRRPSTINVGWLRFTHWATGQGIDPLGPTAAQIAVCLLPVIYTYITYITVTPDY